MGNSMKIKKLVNVAAAAVISSFSAMAVETVLASPAQAPAHAWSSPCDWGGCYGPGPFYGPSYYGLLSGPGYYGASAYIACSTPFDCPPPAGRVAAPSSYPISTTASRWQ